MKGRIEQIAYIGWLGIDYEAITLDKGAFTGLIGPSGAGKSTLTMCLAYAQLPDRRVLDIRPISDLQDPHNAAQARTACLAGSVQTTATLMSSWTS